MPSIQTEAMDKFLDYPELIVGAGLEQRVSDIRKNVRAQAETLEACPVDTLPLEVEGKSYVIAQGFQVSTQVASYALRVQASRS